MAERLSFRWSYIMTPLAVFLLSITLSACFYHLLPAEVACHFRLDGTPDNWLSREMTMVLLLTPQLFFVLLGGGIAWGVIKLSLLFGQIKSTGVRLERVVLFMGNLIALPQLIFCFAMVDIFSYNLYQRHIMSIWIFPLVILGLVTIALGIFLVYILSKARE
jgi:uncharacterized membrane protein